MPKVSNYTQTRVELLYKQGLYPAEIFKLSKGEGLLVSFASVTRITLEQSKSFNSHVP